MNHCGLHHKKGEGDEEILFCCFYYDFHFCSDSNVRLGHDDD